MIYTYISTLLQNQYLSSKILYMNELELQKDIFSTKNYERYEFLGDRFLEAIISKYIYLRYPDENEGFLTIVKKALVNTNILNEIMIKSKLIRFVKNSNKYINEDIFEALIGYLSLNNSFENLYNFIIEIYESHIDFGYVIESMKDYKTLLNDFSHKYFKDLPQYFYNNLTKICNIKLNDFEINAFGISKVDAEKEAAKKMFLMLEKKMIIKEK